MRMPPSGDPPPWQPPASTGRHHCGGGECVIVSTKHNTEQTCHKAATEGKIFFSANGAWHDRRAAPVSCLSQDQDQLLQEHFLSSLAGPWIGREGWPAAPGWLPPRLQLWTDPRHPCQPPIPPPAQHEQQLHFRSVQDSSGKIDLGKKQRLLNLKVRLLSEILKSLGIAHMTSVTT